MQWPKYDISFLLTSHFQSLFTSHCFLSVRQLLLLLSFFVHSRLWIFFFFLFIALWEHSMIFMLSNNNEPSSLIIIICSWCMQIKCTTESSMKKALCIRMNGKSLGYLFMYVEWRKVMDLSDGMILYIKRAFWSIASIHSCWLDTVKTRLCFDVSNRITLFVRYLYFASLSLSPSPITFRVFSHSIWAIQFPYWFVRVQLLNIMGISRTRDLSKLQPG